MGAEPVDPPPLRVQLLGGFRVEAGGEPVEGLGPPRLQMLLAALLLQRGRPVARTALAGSLWPESSEAQARTNLRNLWHRLRQRLPGADTRLRADDNALGWDDSRGLELDVAVFEGALAKALASTRSNPGADASADRGDNATASADAIADATANAAATRPAAARESDDAATPPRAPTPAAAPATADRLDAVNRALAVATGEFLPSCSGAWVQAERERLAQARRRALALRVQLLEAQGAQAAARDAAQAWLAADPLHEPACRSLMRLHAALGERGAALQVFERCAALLRAELAVEPDRSTLALADQLRGGNVPKAAHDGPALLVGRQAAWQRLQRAWRGSETTPQLVLVTGEAGIGKTRLAEAMAEWVTHQGGVVRTAACHPGSNALAFAPLAAWLRAMPLPPLAPPWRRELARLLPELLAVGPPRSTAAPWPHPLPAGVPAQRPPPLPPPPPIDEPWQRLRLFEAVVQVLRHGARPELLILDDLQWCDPHTLDLLQHLLAAPPGPPRLVLATLRSEDADADPLRLAWRAELDRRGVLETVEISALDAAETATLAAQLRGHPLSPRMAQRLHRHSEGHPLYIVEALRAGFDSEDGRATPPNALLPQRFRALLAARLAQLSATTRDLVELAAVIGRDFGAGLLARAGSLDADTLAAGLDEAWRRRIVRAQGGDRFDFAHLKLREAALDAIGPVRRRWLHAKVAQALQAGPEGDADPAALVQHHAAAGDARAAIAAWQRQAARARALADAQGARQALDSALALLGQGPADAADSRLHLALHEALGDLHAWQAQHAAARDAYAAAVASDAIDSVDPLATARLIRKAAATLAQGAEGWDAVAGPLDRAEALLGTPRNAAARHEWCELQLERLRLMYWWRRIDAMPRLLARVRGRILRDGQPLQRAALHQREVQWLLHRHRYRPTPALVASSAAALAQLPPETSLEQRAGSRFAHGFVLLWAGRLDAAGDLLRETLQAAEESGDVMLQARCLAYLAQWHRSRGEVEATAERAARARALAEAQGLLNYAGAALAHQAWVAWRQGEVNAADECGQAALAAWARFGAPYPFAWQASWPLLAVALALDDVAAAADHAQALCAPDQQALAPAVERRLRAALQAWGAGRSETARRGFTAALSLAGDNPPPTIEGAAAGRMKRR